MALTYESDTVSQMHDRHREPAAPASGLKRAGSLLRRPRVRLGAVVALLAVAGFVAWAVVTSTDDGSSPSPPAAREASGRIGPIKVSARGLATLAGALRQPIYWMGPKPGYTYELTRTSKGVYVRYLPPGVQVGDPRASFTIITTWPFPDAYRGLKRVAGGSEIAIPGGGIAVVHQGYPRSVHVAFPGVSDYQVEVYDPSPARALQIALSGKVRPAR